MVGVAEMDGVNAFVPHTKTSSRAKCSVDIAVLSEMANVEYC